MASIPVSSPTVPWVSRRPTLTATMATEIEARSSRAEELRKARRRVRIVAARWRWLTSPICSAWRSARP